MGTKVVTRVGDKVLLLPVNLVQKTGGKHLPARAPGVERRRGDGTGRHKANTCGEGGGEFGVRGPARDHCGLGGMSLGRRGGGMRGGGATSQPPIGARADITKRPQRIGRGGQNFRHREQQRQLQDTRPASRQPSTTAGWRGIRAKPVCWYSRLPLLEDLKTTRSIVRGNRIPQSRRERK